MTLPMTIDERIFPPHKIALLIDVLHEEGVSPAQALAGSGLDHPALSLPGTRISMRQLLTVYTNAQRLSQDPALALRAGRRAHITHYGLYGYALISSPSIRSAADFAIRFHKLATPTATMQVREQGQVASWIFESAFEIDPASELYRFIMEFQFAIILSVSQDMLGPQVKPIEVCAMYAPPAHAELYPIHLECPAHFGQPANELRFDASILDVRPSLANPITAAMVLETCDQMLGEMQNTSGVASKVHGLLLQNPGQFPDEEAMAEKLHMVSRTLRRKLGAEGTSYKQILCDVRKQLALKYLRETRLGVDDIALLLGFSDASSFRQAFRRWTDKNPSDFRPN